MSSKEEKDGLEKVQKVVQSVDQARELAVLDQMKAALRKLRYALNMAIVSVPNISPEDPNVDPDLMVGQRQIHGQ